MDQENTLDIAIIGMSARFPGAPNLDTFWENLRDGKESIRFFTDEELASYHATDDPDYVKAAPALDDIDKFDAAFFGYAPREAQMMDPQHRLLLECATSALEHSGYASSTYDGLISVFAGSAMNTYLLFSGLAPHYIDEYLPTLIGNDKDFLATRISYKLNLKGPSVTVQTACSTALVATHMACQSLLNGESDIALAGAVSVRVPHNAGHQYIPGSVFTPDGHCRPFDAKANGTIFGSGVGVVVLKRLDEALEDGDYIHAVIKGTAINNDGASKVDYTAPSVESQSEAIAEALGVSGVDASTISYVEAHGTGTAIGDPIEVAALTKAYRNYTDKNGFCAIGSVKSNIGHLDVAAGMAGMIKTILALKHKQLPPTLHYTEPNPEIRFPNTPFFVNDKLTSWNALEGVRRAGVSALGIGGTNAHIILEEAPEQPPSRSSSKHHLLVWSAKTEEALDQATDNLKQYLISNPGVSLNDVAYTLQTGRNRFAHKRCLVAEDTQEAIEIFEKAKPGRISSSAQKAVSRELIFMFPGQGAQYVNMGRDLYELESVFRDAIDECADILHDVASIDLKALLYPTEGNEQPATESIKQTKHTQPALFAVCYAMAKQLEYWGISANGYIGHSIGEYVAACLAGVFSLDDALGIVVQRGKLMQDMPEGSMLAVSLAEQEIQQYLDDRVSLAAVNAAELCVVSGTHEAIDALEKKLSALDIQAKKLHTSHGFHSYMMQPAADAFFDYLNQITLHPPLIPFISNVSGTWISADQATDARYWANHLRNAVLFERGLHTLLQDASRVFVEVGPGRTLTSFLRMHSSRTKTHAAITSMRHPKDTESDQSVVLHALGNLWLNGVNPNWDALDEGLDSRRIPLPTYPFKRQSHWFKSTSNQSDSPYIQAPAKQSKQPGSILFAPGWKRALPFPKVTRVPSSTWLLFTDNSPFSIQLEKELNEQGHTVITVIAGSVFEHKTESSWSINPEERLHYDELLRSIKQAGHLPQFILHAWNVNDRPVTPENQLKQSSKQLLSTTFYSLLYLAQAAQQQDMVHPMTLGVLSVDVHDITGSELINPIHGTLHGPCRVIEKESPNIQCIQLDLETRSINQQAFYVEEILSCITHPPAHKTLALRGKHFWVPEFSPITLDVKQTDVPVKQKGVYLITGGLGGLGLAFANWLAKEYKAILFLLGRSPIPERKEWTAILNDAEAKSTLKAKIKAIQHLESQGATVIPLQANVTNLEEMRNTIDRITKKQGTLNGVIHTAGVIEDTLIPLKDANSAQRVLAPKVQGTLVLGHVLKEPQLDFFVLCSSINAYLSPAGQIDYTAANGFQDAFAYAYKQVTGINTISINWPGWKETGMLAEKKEAFGDQAWFKREYNRGILTEEGIEALKGALALGTPQLIVSKEPIDLETDVLDHAPKEASAIKPSSNGAIKHTTENGTLPENASTKAQLQHIWSQVLGVEQIGVHDDFFEMGGHSLLAVTLFKKMEKSLGALHLPISALIQAPTIAKFSPLIKRKPEENRWSPLVSIQEGRSSIPLFCVHGAGGNILIYRELAAQLGSEYTVYGLESQGLDGKQELLSSISDMAAQYIEEIQRIHPEGPYLLLGYCMGGTIALEMAQQLRSANQEVPFLGLIETYNWINLKPENAVSKARYLFQKIEFHTRNLLLLSGEKRKMFWQDKVSTLKRRQKVWSGMRSGKETANGADPESMHHTTLANVWKNNDDAALVYQPNYYKGRITHFRPQQEYAIYSSGEMKFDKLAEEVETRILPVYPAGMMVPPFVKKLAKEIRERIEPVVKAEASVNEA